ncbi:glycosyltransferase family protein [Leptothrix discophora]|uniref:Glycosyltransferase n=1 Tax=Leptothrix discophora TaxID=89 RepID=A0ABT9G047_LEPDI|nr:glycosyltransferase [Leptothrix discophora]MDP4299855.1 glycosyltransferase [Leptothrix discophora]
MNSIKNTRIGFLGSINAMPMAYALRFHRDGFDVKYVVDALKNDTLNRPEHQFSREISYPYPPWIIESPVDYRLATHAFAETSYTEAARHMADRDVIFLNHYGLALSNKLPRSAKLIALSSGSDIDVHCNKAAIWPNSFDIRRKWLQPLALALNHIRTHKQRRGLSQATCISYFPQGLNSIGDNIVAEFLHKNKNTKFIPRFDVDFESTGIRFSAKKFQRVRKIIIPVRLNINPSPGSSFEYKGNDLIIEALAMYSKHNPEATFHLTSKGPAKDLSFAQELCRKLGIESRVNWLKPMPLPDLLEEYYSSDICIDQVGSHWMGAIGAYALYSGTPLIANWRPEVFAKEWGSDVPIMQATTAEQIYSHLIACDDPDFRRGLSVKSHDFAKKFLSAEIAYQAFLNFIST